MAAADSGGQLARRKPATARGDGAAAVAAAPGTPPPPPAGGARAAGATGVEAEGKKTKGRFKKAGRTVLQGVRAIDQLKSIRLSIINVPFRRRLQTFCTALWLFMIPCGTLAMWCITVLALLWPLTCVPTALYLLFIFSWDKRSITGTTPQLLRYSIVWDNVADYFPIELRKTVDLDPGRKFVFGYHPHGVISMGALINFATDATGFAQLFPGLSVHVMTLRSNFLTPLLREFILHMGICEASLKACHTILKQGNGSAIMLAVGGAAEALDARPGSIELTLAKRKGFVRVAVATGASLVPVFSFGENELWNALPNPEGSNLRKLQNAMKKSFKFTFPAIHGRGLFNYDFGWMPHRRKIVSVVGRPIDIEEAYTGDLYSGEGAALVDTIHAQYIQGLRELFEANKAAVGIPGMENQTLVIK